MLTQESVNTITKVLISSSFYGFNNHISEDCSCYEEDSQSCEVIQEGITFDGSTMWFNIEEGRVSIEMFIDNEHGDAEIYLVCIHNVVDIEFQVLLNRGVQWYVSRLEEGSSSPIMRLWNIQSYLESL